MRAVSLGLLSIVAGLSLPPNGKLGRSRRSNARMATSDASWPLLRTLRRAVYEYELISPGDQIAVAVSGGKDSSTLLYLFKELKERRMLPFDDWNFLALHLDQAQPGHHVSPLSEWVEKLGVPFHGLREDTYAASKPLTPNLMAILHVDS